MKNKYKNMHNFQDQLSEFLIEGNFVPEKKLRDLKEIAEKDHKNLVDLLSDARLLADDQLGQIVADLKGWQFVNLRHEVIDKEMLKLIPRIVAKNQHVLAFKGDEKTLTVAMANPSDSGLIHMLQKRSGRMIIPLYATNKDIQENLFLYRNEIGDEFEKLIAEHAQQVELDDAKDSAIVKIVNLLLSHGYEMKSSDIHIEPQKEDTTVRYRIDGVMYEILDIPKNIHDLVITRLKIMAKLRTDEHYAAQDGKFEYELEDETIDVRVSIVPTIKGENCVMRLLSGKSRQYSLEELGLGEKDYAKLRDQIKKPWGMVLATGPTGSGKTTSLYAILKIINNRDINIETIEDPVEYNIDGITQIQVNPKTNLTFAAGLRSIVRQDPNVIMVGEIRDAETADIAVNSAMTGHLVLSTLHTNDAATTLPRILDMGIERFLVASTVNVAIAQRLMRKICSACISSYETNPDELEKIVPKQVVLQLAQEKEKMLLYKGQGCDLCKYSGYLGRIGVFEIMEITPEIKALIMKNADADAIKAQAIAEGMTTMLDDAMEKVRNGMTTVEEMLRVVKY